MSDQQAEAVSGDDNQLSTVAQAKDYLRNYNGLVMNKTMSLSCQVMQQIYKREGALFQRNGVYITYFARMIFSADQLDVLDKHLLTRMQDVKREMNAELALCKASLENASVYELAGNAQTQNFEAPFMSPMYRLFLELIQLGDNLETHYHTMWLHSLMENRDFHARRKQLKKSIRQINTDVRNGWLSLIKRAGDEKAKKESQIAAKKARRKRDLNGPVEVISGEDADANSVQAEADLTSSNPSTLAIVQPEPELVVV